MLVKQRNTPVFNSIFDEFFRDWSSSNFSKTNTTLPAVNIKEEDTKFTVEVAVPGMEKEDFNIHLDDNILTISSEKSYEKTEENEDDKYTRREYSFQSFKRSFTLPKTVVDEDKIEASYKNGELIIEIPKREEKLPAKKTIEVK